MSYRVSVPETIARFGRGSRGYALSKVAEQTDTHYFEPDRILSDMSIIRDTVHLSADGAAWVLAELEARAARGPRCCRSGHPRRTGCTVHGVKTPHLADFSDLSDWHG